MFGLPSSAIAIAAAAADPASTSTDLGTPLTPSERHQLQEAELAGQNVEAVSHTAQAALPASFAGAWFDYADGGTIYVAFASRSCPSQALMAHLNRIAHLNTTAHVKATAVAAIHNVSATRLDALQAAVERTGARLARRGVIINATEIDIPNDRFLVTLDPASVRGSKAIMRKLYGSQGLAFTAPAPPAQAA